MQHDTSFNATRRKIFMDDILNAITLNIYTFLKIISLPCKEMDDCRENRQDRFITKLALCCFLRKVMLYWERGSGIIACIFTIFIS